MITYTITRIGRFCWQWEISDTLPNVTWASVGVANGLNLTEPGAMRAVDKALARYQQSKAWKAQETRKTIVDVTQ